MQALGPALLSERGVVVTPVSVVIGNQTYVVRNITSVRAQQAKQECGCLGAFLVLSGFFTLLHLIGSGPGVGNLGILLVSGAAVWGYLHQAPEFVLFLVTAGGEQRALVADPDFVLRVHDAIVHVVTGEKPAPRAPYPRTKPPYATLLAAFPVLTKGAQMKYGRRSAELWLGGALLVASAVGVVAWRRGGRDQAEEIPGPEQSEPSADAPPEPAPVKGPCEEHEWARTVDIDVCPETSEGPSTIPLVDAFEGLIANLPLGTRIVRLRTATGMQESIRRRPGHVDELVCVLEGAIAGRVGYVKITTLSPLGVCAKRAAESGR